jgi:hypothetical protein
MGKYLLVAISAGLFLCGCSLGEGKKTGGKAGPYEPGQYALRYDVEHEDAEATLAAVMHNWARRNRFKKELILPTDSRSPDRGPQLFRKKYGEGATVELRILPDSTYTGTLNVTLAIEARKITDEMKKDLRDFDRRFPPPSKKKAK